MVMGFSKLTKFNVVNVWFMDDCLVGGGGTTKSTRFDLKFFRVLSKNRRPGKLHCTFFSPEKLALLSVLTQVEPSPD